MYANERCIAVKKTQKHVSLKRKCRHKQWTVRRVEWAGACGSPIDFRGHASMARRCMCALCVSEKKQDTHQGIPVCGVYCGEGCSCLLCVCVSVEPESKLRHRGAHLLRERGRASYLRRVGVEHRTSNYSSRSSSSSSWRGCFCVSQPLFGCSLPG